MRAGSGLCAGRETGRNAVPEKGSAAGLTATIGPGTVVRRVPGGPGPCLNFLSASSGLPVTALRISDVSGEYNTGHFPMKVDSLDENFLVVKREANLCLSHDLAGFHFYAADLCRIANVIGRTAWVVDFHLFHKSRGNLDDHFYEIRDRFIQKYRRAFRGGVLQAVCTRVHLSGNAFACWLFNPGPRQTLFDRIYELRKQSRRESRADLTGKIQTLHTRLGLGWHAFFWLRHKINRPFENLRRWLGKKRRHPPAPGPGSATTNQ